MNTKVCTSSDAPSKSGVRLVDLAFWGLPSVAFFVFYAAFPQKLPDLKTIMKIGLVLVCTGAALQVVLHLIARTGSRIADTEREVSDGDLESNTSDA